ncbi:RNA polymerase sigma factor [Algibacter luteus]|uniref:RNA polymerase, sigma subunit, ECF family n=1 Tax=Algibacter luteus TaxID=1178825 RepID=A0A1M6CIE5_9FLAO|nr:sigma-70 family RNA polymerase sigma factor [Algibacter luteus]SHI60766.1 RNA polymerase, sigma subunit, ECF family [Algibacter luteus]
MTINDQHYIDLINKGDTNAFVKLVDRYKDLVYTLTLRMLKNREEAEEVSQDTFIKVYKSINQYKGESKFSTWIYRIAYNSSLDRLKKNRKYFNNVAIDEFTEHQVKTIDNALSKLEDEERNHAIQKCIGLLSSDDAFLLTLYYFEDQNLDEISKVIGLTINNVKVKLFRSRKKLATIMMAHLEPEIIEHYGRERN